MTALTAYKSAFSILKIYSEVGGRRLPPTSVFIFFLVFTSVILKIFFVIGGRGVDPSWDLYGMQKYVEKAEMKSRRQKRIVEGNLNNK